MRRARTDRTALAVLLFAAVAGCAPDRGVSEVTVVLDGDIHTMDAKVTCTEYPGGQLLILAAPPAQTGSKKIVRVLLATRGRFVVHAAGIRYGEVQGFTNDSDQMIASKVDDVYDISGRMPPDIGAQEWRQFKIEITCPGYSTPSPGFQGPPLAPDLP